MDFNGLINNFFSEKHIPHPGHASDRNIRSVPFDPYRLVLRRGPADQSGDELRRNRRRNGERQEISDRYHRVALRDSLKLLPSVDYIGRRGVERTGEGESLVFGENVQDGPRSVVRRDGPNVEPAVDPDGSTSFFADSHAAFFFSLTV